MASITSTVPGAIQTLQSYMQTVADANPSLNIGVFVGEPVAAEVTDNFLIIGAFDTWVPIDMDTYEWAAIPGQSGLVTENYSLQGCLRTMDGDLMTAFNNSFLLLNGLHTQIRTDLRATAVTSTGALSTSGSWNKLEAHIEAFGPIDNVNNGVVIGFSLSVCNVQINNS